MLRIATGDKLPCNNPLRFNRKLPNHILLPLDESLENENVLSSNDHFPINDLLSFDDNDITNDNESSNNDDLPRNITSLYEEQIICRREYDIKITKTRRTLQKIENDLND
ncbi:unnamed protein product, partial [Adineta steineri]